jgi:Domain of unknown function (DUF5666)
VGGVLLLLGLAPLGARAADPCGGDAGGIGGTGAQPTGKPPGDTKKGKDRGGVGGTGISERDGGGIGGTGIVGVITGFGSVCVNGLEVGYDAGSRVETDGEPSAADRLEVGQLVVIEAERRDGELWAKQLAVRNVAVGPIAASDARRGEIEVLGQRVMIDDATRLADAGGAALGRGDLTPGRFVAVSGLRRANGSVVATRIESRAPRAQVSVSGPLSAQGRDQFAVAGLGVVPPAGGVPPAVVDDIALVVGRLDAATGTLHAERIEPALDFAAAPERLSVEGFVQQRSSAGFRIDHIDVDVSKLGAGAAVATADTRVVVSGPVAADGRLKAERIDLVAPERAAVDDRAARESRGNSGPGTESNAAASTDERVEKVETSETPEPVEVPEQPEQVEMPETVEPHEAPETPEHVETPETPEVGHAETPERGERPETPETPELPEPVEHPETPEVERPETPERVELPEVPELPEAPEIPEHVEVPELPEVERPELPEVERPEPPEPIEVPEIERPEAPEPPELPEAPESH